MIAEGKERVQVFNAQIVLFWNVFTSLWSQQMEMAGTFYRSPPFAAWESVGVHFTTDIPGYRH